MTVGELIEWLGTVDPSLRVVTVDGEVGLDMEINTTEVRALKDGFGPPRDEIVAVLEPW